MHALNTPDPFFEWFSSIDPDTLLTEKDFQQDYYPKIFAPYGLDLSSVFPQELPNEIVDSYEDAVGHQTSSSNHESHGVPELIVLKPLISFCSSSKESHTDTHVSPEGKERPAPDDSSEEDANTAVETDPTENSPASSGLLKKDGSK